VTPFLLATISDDHFFSGLHWYEEQAISKLIGRINSVVKVLKE